MGTKSAGCLRSAASFDGNKISGLPLGSRSCFMIEVKLVGCLWAAASLDGNKKSGLPSVSRFLV
ncbi:MAG: hypothetical protein FWD26_09795 [Treponema sp.]|nr:hypothetical protein [Treponema sp.]